MVPVRIVFYIYRHTRTHFPLHTRYYIAAADLLTTSIICSKSVHSDHTDVEVTNSCIRYDALDVIGLNVVTYR